MAEVDDDPRRRHPRRAVPERVELFDTMTEERIGQVGNLSAGGMLLVADRALCEDALYQLRFDLPNGRGTRQFEVGAHILWQESGNDAQRYWVGVRFIGLSSEDARHLRRWAETPDAS